MPSFLPFKSYNSKLVAIVDDDLYETFVKYNWVSSGHPSKPPRAAIHSPLPDGMAWWEAKAAGVEYEWNFFMLHKLVLTVGNKSPNDITLLLQKEWKLLNLIYESLPRVKIIDGNGRNCQRLNLTMISVEGRKGYRRQDSIRQDIAFESDVNKVAINAGLKPLQLPLPIPVSDTVPSYNSTPIDESPPPLIVPPQYIIDDNGETLDDPNAIIDPSKIRPAQWQASQGQKPEQL